MPVAIQFAHSDRFALPRITAPARRRRAVTVASRRGTAPSSAIEPAVVGMSMVPTLSLSSTGIP